MLSVDLNADLAEGDELTHRDLAVLDSVTSASLACGFHAGSSEVMRATASACVDRGVTVGAHVSFRDREGFGRRALAVEPDRLIEDILEQCGRLLAEATAVGAMVSFVKPHGALYHQMGIDTVVADAVVEAMVEFGIDVLVCQPGTVVVERAVAAGVRTVAEGFPDRGYLADGRLAPRQLPGGMVHDPEAVGQRAISLVRQGGVEAIDGTWVPVAVDTLCIHGDADHADVTAAVVRRTLASAGIALERFAGSGRPAPFPTSGPAPSTDR